MNNAKKSDSSLTHIKSKIKVVFLGDQSTGKTCILLRFMYDKFEEGQGVTFLFTKATVGIDFMAKNFTVHNFHLRLQLWDTAGQ
jgi:small GTP-binding protein